MKAAKVIDRASLFEIITQCGHLKENITKDIEEFKSERILKNSLMRKNIDETIATLKQKKLDTIKVLNEKVITLRHEICANLQPQISTANMQYEVVIKEDRKRIVKE